MRKCVKKKELDAANTAYEIAKIDVLSLDHQVTASQVVGGFAAAATHVRGSRRRKLVSYKCYEFRRACCTMLATIDELLPKFKKEAI